MGTYWNPKSNIVAWRVLYYTLALKSVLSERFFYPANQRKYFVSLLQAR